LADQLFIKKLVVKGMIMIRIVLVLSLLKLAAPSSIPIHKQVVGPRGEQIDIDIQVDVDTGDPGPSPVEPSEPDPGSDSGSDSGPNSVSSAEPQPKCLEEMILCIGHEGECCDGLECRAHETIKNFFCMKKKSEEKPRLLNKGDDCHPEYTEAICRDGLECTPCHNRACDLLCDRNGLNCKKPHKCTEKKQEEECGTEFDSCEVTGARPGTLPNICTQRADPGLCLADFPMYYFDAGSKTCQKFSYGGCGGNGNRFPTEAACLTTCMGSSLGKKCCEGYICQTYPTNQCIKIVKQICIMTGGACIPGHPIEKCCPNNICTIKGESFLAQCVEEIGKPKQHCLATGDPCTPGDPINKCCPNNLCDLDNKVCVQVAWKNKNV